MASIAYKNAHFVKTIYPRGKRLLSTNHKIPFQIDQSIQSDLTILDIDNKTGTATMSMNNPPVNALGIDLLKRMKSNLEEVQKSNARGLILTSSLENVFSAGHELGQLYTSNKDALTELISVTQDVAELLHSFPIPLAALVNGHAIGGGCILASCCEYRAMMPNYKIGATEVTVGIVPPRWMMNCVLEVLDRRTAEIALNQGKQFRTDEALKVGFIDEIVSDKDKGLVKCQEFIDCFKKINSSTRALTKRRFRFKLFTDKKVESKMFVDQLMDSRVQRTIGAYLKTLKFK